MARPNYEPRSPRAAGTRVRWTANMKARFLDELAATCHIADAAAAIGVDPSSVYQLRRRDDDFAAEWQRALAQGYEMLETQLIGHALSGGGAAAITNGDPNRPPINVELAIKLLNDHGARAQGKRAMRGGPPPKVATREETNAAILKKLKAIEGRLAREAAGVRPEGSEAEDGGPAEADTGVNPVSSNGLASATRRPASPATRISEADPLASA